MEDSITNANTNYSDPEFMLIVGENLNDKCFDCGSSGATWASVNNGIFLCANCSAEHRTYGIGVSYIRSIILDKWNESQIKYMKAGGNKVLAQLMESYNVPKEYPRQLLYKTILLDYHRNRIRNQVYGNSEEVKPPALSVSLLQIEENPNGKFASISNTTSDFTSQPQDQTTGFFSQIGSLLDSALGKTMEKTKEVATNFKDRIVDTEIAKKIIDTGSKTVDVIKDTSNVVIDSGIKTVEVIKTKGTAVVDKGTEIVHRVKDKGSELANSETAKSLKGTAESSYHYFYGKIFGENEQQVNTTGVNHSMQIREDANEIDIDPQINDKTPNDSLK